MVLMHRGHVIAYASRELKTHEANYPTHESGAGGGGVCPQDLEALFIWGAVHYLY